MDNLETYNRVPSLESPLLKSALLFGYWLLIGATFYGVIGLAFITPAWPHSLIIASGALIAYSLLYYYDNRRTKTCQFCKGPLSTIVRPFILSSKFLTMTGQKHGDYFFTYRAWGKLPFKKRWLKISHQSYACHHCRLSEVKQHEYHQPVSDDEHKSASLNGQ
jgi:hypothetical protein